MRQVETTAPEQWDGSTWPREVVAPPSWGTNQVLPWPNHPELTVRVSLTHGVRMGQTLPEHHSTHIHP